MASATYQRFPGDDSTEGELDATNAFVTGSAAWYDLGGRATHSAYFGREDVLSAIDPGARFLFDEYGALIDANSDGIPDMAQGSPPAGDTLDVIVTQTVYDPRLTAAGRIVRTIDNAGRIDEVHSDLLGRTVRTIQNYDDLRKSRS